MSIPNIPNIINTPLHGDRIINDDGVATPRFQAFIDEIEKFGNTDDTWYSPASLNVITGTPTGSITDVVTLADGNVYTLVEVSGGMEVDFTFTGVTDAHFSIALRSHYDGSATHICLLQVFNNDTATWDTFIRLSSNSEFNYRYLSINDAAPYILSETVLVRFFHDTPATPGHDLFIDYLAIHS